MADTSETLNSSSSDAPKGVPDRETIIQALAAALRPLKHVHAMWEGGAAAFGRSDQWSDIDLYVDADDASVAGIAPVVEAALERLARIELKYLPPVPPPGNYLHLVYRLQGTPKWLLIDMAVVKHSSPDKFLEPELHGESRFIFNKGGAITCPPADRARLAAERKASLERTRLRFDLLSCFVAKEIARGNHVEALDIYQRLILGSLVEALRAEYDPLRYNYGPRYLKYHLPREVVARLERLYFVKDAEDLEAKYREAEAWFLDLARAK